MTYTKCLVELLYTTDHGVKTKLNIFTFKSSGVVLGMYNTDDSICSFAHACFKEALQRKLPLYFSAKQTILKKYDGRFKQLFEEIYEKNYKSQFEAKKIRYEYKLIDNMVAQVLKSSGGFLWACKNDDGAIQSNFIAQGYGSLEMMTSILICPDGKTVQTEVAHSTFTNDFRLHQKAEQTSTNPIPSIFTWTRALKHRAKLDSTPDVAQFATTLETACIDCVESGKYTKDLAESIHDDMSKVKEDMFLNTQDFLDAVIEQLKKNLKT